MRACLATTSVTIAADGVFQRQEGMFHPRLPDLFKALVISRAAAHTIEILRNERMIGLRQREPINWRVAVKKLVDLDRLHHGADGDRSNYCTGVRWPAHRVGKLF